MNFETKALETTFDILQNSTKTVSMTFCSLSKDDFNLTAKLRYKMKSREDNPNSSYQFRRKKTKEVHHPER